ncbi:MAG TPA: hypothetical protein VGO62_07295 [Myxococcota bacterium]
MPMLSLGERLQQITRAALRSGLRVGEPSPKLKPFHYQVTIDVEGGQSRVDAFVRMLKDFARDIDVV